MLRYIELFPNSLLAEKFQDYGYLREPDDLAKEIEIHFDINKPEQYQKDLGIVTAGLTILKHESYQSAYESDLGKITRMLLDDDHIRYLLAGVREASNILQSLYPVEDHE